MLHSLGIAFPHDVPLRTDKLRSRLRRTLNYIQHSVSHASRKKFNPAIFLPWCERANFFNSSPSHPPSGDENLVQYLETSITNGLARDGAKTLLSDWIKPHVEVTTVNSIQNLLFILARRTAIGTNVFLLTTEVTTVLTILKVLDMYPFTESLIANLS